MQTRAVLARQIGIFSLLVGTAGVALVVSTTHHPAHAEVSLSPDLIERAAFQKTLNDAASRGLGPTTTDTALTTIQGNDEDQVTTESEFSALSIPGTTANDAGFPHPALYGGMNSSGWPLVGTIGDNRPPDGAPLNTAVLDAYAKFPHVILPATPLTDHRPDIITALKSRNPNMTIFAYVMAHTTWCPQDGNGDNSYTPGTYYRDYWLAVTNGDAHCATNSNRLLWLQNGHLTSDPPYDLGINVNLAHRVQNPDTSYTYDVAEAIATTMYNYAKRSRGVDGIFIDVYCSGVLWMEHGDTDPTSFDNSSYFDYARAGYGSNNSDPTNRTAFDAGWAAGHQALATKLRSLADADGDNTLPISGNCGQAGASIHPLMNGWMRENYPYQNGGTFYSNMLTYPWGFLYQDKNFRSPQYNYIFTASNWSGGMTNNPGDEQYNSFNQRKMRYGLGSAALGNGYAAFHDGSGDPGRGLWFNWWYDEYGVKTDVPQSNPLYGTAMNGIQYTGWLGQPLSDYTQMVSTNAASEIITTNRGFETAGASPSQIPGWTFYNFSPTVASITRDTTTAAVGTASAKIHIDVGHATPYYADNIHPTQTLTFNAYQEYSLTFWAKASSNRLVDISMWNGGLIVAFMTIPITTEWRQYQAVMKPYQSTSNGSVDIDLARSTGDVWIDDVSFKTGASMVYRRDFDRGIVLLNPTDSAQTVTLEQPYKRINGSVNPSLNNGATVSSLSIPGTSSGGGTGDAAFLLTIDTITPSTITNLQAGTP